MKVRESIKQMIKDRISPFSIVAAHGRLVSPDEAKLLREYDKQSQPEGVAPQKRSPKCTHTMS